MPSPDPTMDLTRRCDAIGDYYDRGFMDGRLSRGRGGCEHDSYRQGYEHGCRSLAMIERMETFRQGRAAILETTQ
ncbi:hypothetical protein LCGC14_0568730 [marine sediment metagenome]|uniref:Uncharacterized protein n=1 Tax=marine sediment metagenome TaxID=412755 RepID=A0A0F9S3J1_9ZZZZ|nr:hypothetical protein [Phycisphaerae bacterium]